MAEKTLPITGGCLCGAVRFEATEPSSYLGCCHCRKCQMAYCAVSACFAFFLREKRSGMRGESPSFTNPQPGAIAASEKSADAAGHAVRPR